MKLGLSHIRFEWKIRRDSPPEKIFEVFASQKDGDAIYMSHEDFFHSVVPFAYQGEKEEKEGEKEDEKEGVSENWL